jgi:hypothetical protein
VQRQELKRRGEGRRRSSVSGTGMLSRTASSPLLLSVEGLGAGFGAIGDEDEVAALGVGLAGVERLDSSWKVARGRSSTSLGGARQELPDGWRNMGAVGSGPSGVWGRAWERTTLQDEKDA